MIELEIGKAIVAVAGNGHCGKCCFAEKAHLCEFFKCYATDQKDGKRKSVIYKIVDYPPQTELYVDGMMHGSKTTDGR